MNMEEGESVPVLSRKELRKQKLMEYLAAKGKIKPSDPLPKTQEAHQHKRPVASAVKVVTGKENRAHPEGFRRSGQKSPAWNAQSKPNPARRAFGVTNRENVKGSVLKGQQNAALTSSNSGPPQPKPDLNHALTSTYTVVFSKSSLNAAGHLRKQPHTGNQASGKAPSNAARTVRVRSNSKLSLSAASSAPVSAPSTRMSLGPLVKTKTGLIPAVTQPRNTKSGVTHGAATAARPTTALVAKKVRCSDTSSVSLPPRSALGVGSAARAGNKLQVQTKYNCKPLLGKHAQPSCRNQLSNGLKQAASTSLRCPAAAAYRPEGRVAAPRSVSQPADRSTKLEPGVKGQKNGQPSSRAVSRCSSRAAGRVTAGTALGRKTKMGNETDCKKKSCSQNAPLAHTATTSRGAPVLSQTAPQPARTISLTGRATHQNTPKVLVRPVPQTEGKKLTAAQEDRLRKLQEWREAKGVSYKRPPMPAKPVVRRTVSVPQPFWTSMEEEDEAHSLISAVDRSLADCIKLLGEGCSPDQVKEVLSRLPSVSQKFAKYWICRVRLMEQEGDLEVLPVFEEAVGVVLEPVDELRTVVFDILKKKDEIQAAEENEEEHERISSAESAPECDNNPVVTPKAVRALICGEKGDSSVVKYKITATPGGPPSQHREPVRVNGQEVRFFTPVRRSVRIERASLRYPASLQDHDLCVASYGDLISEEETSPSVGDTPMYVYRENEALQDKVLVRLFCDEDV
ncbi:cytoskeleton-associated protein 2-like [Stegastes partitus]|uniref:Cytoskeleton-associated protein 2-like n=1 Tax=Stegastes partitus TaxID=144197 RepID=A0A3B5A4X0_9TELE|nr:PREDICTED: cytoskeleton-associated protein 2-like [Stegastes partitus]